MAQRVFRLQVHCLFTEANPQNVNADYLSRLHSVNQDHKGVTAVKGEQSVLFQYEERLILMYHFFSTFHSKAMDTTMLP